ncbi:hypothetical protein MJO28_013758 [Puccinia striiformis f. sp. tritici]|uniref:Uncharacterized protein n=1 Tax=Puccinia striiformis f. sp. tritici TaxID=168172 RepID=A0ACC0DVJ7_9BASI|nr:hypothetical protein MJO28_013758 [Puccinia striiformis f. sp. tritici]
MQLALRKILIIAEIFYCSSKLNLAGQLHKRASVHPTTDELGHVDCDTEVIGFVSEQIHTQCYHEFLTRVPKFSASASDIVEYPRRAVNWQEFRTVRYVPQRNTFVAIDIPEDYGKISNQKENIKDRTWAKGKVKALKGWIENTEQYQLEGSSETCGICQEEYDSDHSAVSLRVFPNCNHFFHAHCIEDWLDRYSPLIESQSLFGLSIHNFSCPTCRAPAPILPIDLNYLGAICCYHRKSLALALLYITLIGLLWIMAKQILSTH